MLKISLRRLRSIYFLTLFLGCLSIMTSCNSKKRLVRQTDIIQLSEKLGFKIHHKDDIPLYAEAAKWLGTPYKYGGTTLSGMDCSGLVGQIYKNVYKKTLDRTAKDMEENNCRKISKSNLEPGDLVFFNTSKKKKGINHVGIFLKKDYFIHASSSQGVIINNLHESYYKKHWSKAGKVKK